MKSVGVVGDESHFNVVMGQNHKPVSINHNFCKGKATLEELQAPTSHHLADEGLTHLRFLSSKASSVVERRSRVGKSRV